MPIDAQPPRGTRDLLPAAARRRQYVVDTIREVVELYGFDPLDTPAVELQETLLGKYGPDAERLIYRAGLKEPTDLALRYDLSVPLARVAASYDELPRPFRRYQVAAVWRGERPQRGRYREILQADADIVGSASMLADAEIISLVIEVLRRLGFANNVTKINNRKLLTAVGRFAGVDEALLPGLYRSIDKLDKIGLEGVRLELRSVGLPGDLLNRQRQGVERWRRGKVSREVLAAELAPVARDQTPSGAADQALPAYLDALEGASSGGESPLVMSQRALAASIDALRPFYPAEAVIADDVTERLLDLVCVTGDGRDRLAELDRRLEGPAAREGLLELASVMDALEQLGLPRERYAFDPSMVRGLEYYTGTIFETVVTDPPIGSITGGGRFDELIGLFGKDLPAVGTSFGVDRLVDVMDEHDLFPSAVDAPAAAVLVARFDADTSAAAMRLASLLRAAGVKTELYYDLDGLGDQIRYALRREIPVVAIIGPDEAAAGQVTLRNLSAKAQETVPTSEAEAAIRRILASIEAG